MRRRRASRQGALRAPYLGRTILGRSTWDAVSGTPLLVQPHIRQILPHVVTGRDVPALHHLVVHDDAVPPDGGNGVGLLERALLELAQEGVALLLVQLAGLLVEQVV